MNNLKNFTKVDNHAEFISNPTGFQYAILPYTIDPVGPLKTNIENAKILKTQKKSGISDFMPFGENYGPMTLDPRPAVKIGYELRN